MMNFSFFFKIISYFFPNEIFNKLVFDSHGSHITVINFNKILDNFEILFISERHGIN